MNISNSHMIHVKTHIIHTLGCLSVDCCVLSLDAAVGQEIDIPFTAMLKSTVTSNRFRLECIVDNDANVAFYTGFPTHSHPKCCFDFL